MQDISPTANRSVTLDSGGAETVTVRATYTANGSTHEVTRTVDLERNVTGTVRLTSVDITPRGGTVSIAGEAANVGGTDVRSVLLTVQDTEAATPVQGSGEFFVGQIEASEFATFDLAVSVDPGAASIPVEITYIVDGERVTTTRQFDIGSSGVAGAANGTGGARPAAEASTPAASGGPLSSLPVLAVGVVLVTALGAAAIYRRRNR